MFGSFELSMLSKCKTYEQKEKKRKEKEKKKGKSKKERKQTNCHCKWLKCQYKYQVEYHKSFLKSFLLFSFFCCERPNKILTIYFGFLLFSLNIVLH